MLKRRVYIVGNDNNKHFWMNEFTKSYGKFVRYKRFNGALINVHDKVEVEYLYVNRDIVSKVDFNTCDTIYLEPNLPNEVWLNVIYRATKLELNQIEELCDLSVSKERRKVVIGCLS